MIKSLHSFFLLTFILLFSSSISGQTFSGQTFTFPDELKEVFKTAPDKKEAKLFLDTFEAYWINGGLDDDLKQLIISTCSTMAEKNARPFPDYATYLNTIKAFDEKGHNKDSFNNWHQAVEALLKQRRFAIKKLNEFLDQSKDLISSNTIFSTSAVAWKCTGYDYGYQYEGDKLVVKVGPTDLVCLARNDSIKVFATEGVFYPFEAIWKGKKGKVTWERSGYDAEKVYATFDAYEIDMKKPELNVDSVQFLNKHYFEHILEGSLSHKVTTVKSPDQTSYPKFTTTKQRFSINDIHSDINYEGGFSQSGAKFLGAGTQDNPAVVTINRNNQPFITAKSLYFALRDDQILSNDTEVRIALDSGSIYHPNLVFKYMADLNEIHLIRSGEGLSKSPYFDTYHNISMDVELIQWQLGSDTLNLRMLTGAAQNHAYFESLSYFREDFYNRLQGMDAMHPLQGLKNCSDYFHGHPFTASDYARYIGLPENPVRQQIMELSFYGFIEYNINTDEIVVKERLKDYLLFRLGKKDYDVIRFNSETPSGVMNAQLDLNTRNLSLKGVDAIAICDHQNVVFFPKNKEIELKGNRNFIFNGTINAGMLNLYGDGFEFSYDNFRIDMSNIDSMKMKVLSGDTDYFGKALLLDVDNTIAHLSGHLQIDEPDNKSGAKRNPGFPVLSSDVESYVYFDNKSIRNGAYARDSFHFTLDPFEMDSINTLSRDNFNFGGVFESNIFPTFRDSLTIREDYSLGFVRVSPEEGYPVYGDKARFTNTIDLSNQGLKGDGILAFATTTTASEDLVFLPDRVIGQAHSFLVDTLQQDNPFPDVKASYVAIEYLPEDEYIMAKSQEENFVMYKEEAQLKGELKVTANAASGGGTFYMRNANLVSQYMDFSDHIVMADSSNFHLESASMDGVSFATDSLIATIDFDKRKGVFSSLTKGSRVDFTKNRYISYISEFSWEMDNNDIYMGTKGSKGNLFVSTHRRQDSLAFFVPMAKYDVESKTIFAEDVEQIDVGDANLFLSNGRVTIREAAVLDPIDSVTIVLQKDSTFTHKIHDARVNILGRLNYSGYGQYDFVNGNDKTMTIALHNIELNKEGETVAEGQVKEDDMFSLDQHFAFKGDVKLEASHKNLMFNGGAQMLHRCNSGPQTYVRFTSRINPDSVMIPLSDKLENFEYANIYKDFFITKDSTHVYSSFLEDRDDYSDIPMLTGEGFLVYNEANHSFDIASAEKLAQPDTVGKIIRFQENNCSIYAEGEFNLGVDFNDIQLRNSGVLLDERDKGKISASTMMGLDFPFDNHALDLLYSIFLNSPGMDSRLSGATYTRRLSEWVGIEKAVKIEDERNGTGASQALPADLQYMFLFSNIDFVFDEDTRSFVADGHADLAYLKQFITNRQVDVKAEISRRRSGNTFDLYVEFDEKNWVYFTYKNGLLQTVSSNEEYNKLIQTLEPDERKRKISFGESFTFIMAPESKKNRFLTRFQ